MNTFANDFDNTRDYARFLRGRAEEMDIKLPPLGPRPSRWTKSLRTPVGEPPKLSSKPMTFVRRLLLAAWRPLVLQTILMTISSVAGALVPWVMGNMINGVIAGGFDAYTRTQVLYFLGLVLLIAVSEGIGQLAEIATWFSGSLLGAWAVGHRVARAGRAAKTEEPAGEVVTALVNDSDYLGAAFLWFSQAIATLAATLVIFVIMFRVSPTLGMVVAVGVPLAIAMVTALARPLQKKLAVQREAQGKLTTVSTDAVAGLRVLRGIGGEDAYNARYRAQSDLVREAGIAAASNQAALVMLRNAIPQLLIAVVLGYGAYLVFADQLGVGDLVAFYGYALYMRMPIGTATGLVHTWSRAWVGAKKLAASYSLESDVSDSRVDPSLAVPDWNRAELVDVETGVSIAPGRFAAVVCTVPETSVALARRLGRVTDEDACAVTVDGVDLRKFPLEQVRAGIYLSESSAQIFRESLQNAIAGADAPEAVTRGSTELIYREHIEDFMTEENTLYLPDPVRDSERIRKAIRVTDAEDVVMSLPAGLAGELAEKGRNISGGQRQRVALARAVYAEAPVLILVEPTSAVDTHTEARIAQNLKDSRRGMTTVVVTLSPLFLGICDEVIVLGADGHPIARGRHEDLLAGSDTYRSIVTREVSGE